MRCFLDLFAGIGGFALGAYWAGLRFDRHYFSEIDPWCCKLYQRRFPDAIPLGDIASISGLPSGDWIITGGFPCQDLSFAGKGAGLKGRRSGLWNEMARIIGDFRPRFIIVENVPALLDRGMEDVLGDLAERGYDAEWEVLGADSIGASQHRHRLWILAYPNNAGLQGPIWAGKPHPPRKEWTTAYSEPLRSTHGYWPPGPRAINDIPRMADGPAHKLDRLRGLGNAIVPQIAEMIFRQLREERRP